MRAVESVLRQTARDFQLIAVDDGSTDGTGDALRRFVSELLPLRRSQRLGLVPLLAAASLAASSAEAAGMLATLAAPERMRRLAERN